MDNRLFSVHFSAKDNAFFIKPKQKLVQVFSRTSFAQTHAP
ncbi:hypothetical protein NEIELOOT_02535 [Neisseria elongata subsp. glycolytica ATCC 29315]|uniref:Uncharacterized protein n=1 Tax=Neisseria elongata subsp. glycolytica ATCC 29315 TaxID=546263 RepID=D4DTX8_NEIEG|nr:hypothetical protein NEIELOOT_02535 [Neisseria elongata subsp. glycolytica ATCC 29315]